jgi:hypothetical protein
MVPECDESTAKVRGVAAADGWLCWDLHGPGGNKYGNICPDHTAEGRKMLVDQLKSISQIKE